MENQIGEEGERLNKHTTTRLPRHKLKFGVAEILGAGVGGRVSHSSRSRSPQNPPTDPSTPEETNIEVESESWCSKTPLPSPSPPTPTSLPHPALLRLSLPRPSFSTSSPIFSPPLLFPYTSSPFLQPPPLAQPPSLPTNPLPFLQTQHLSTWYPSKRISFSNRKLIFRGVNLFMVQRLIFCTEILQYWTPLFLAVSISRESGSFRNVWVSVMELWFGPFSKCWFLDLVTNLFENLFLLVSSYSWTRFVVYCCNQNTNLVFELANTSWTFILLLNFLTIS